MDLISIDYVVVFFYLLIVIFFGFHPIIKRKKTEPNLLTKDFIFAGRKVTLPFFVASLVATWYGNILGIGEFVHRNGLLAWFCFGVVYYFSAIAFAFLLSSKIKKSFAHTIPEQISQTFGKKNLFLSSIIILLITFPSVYVLMVGIFVQVFFNLNLNLSIVFATFFCFSYIFVGGFKTNILTNTAQFLIMYTGFFIFTYFSLNSVGWDLNFISLLPKYHLHLFGGTSWQYVVSWVLISFQTFVDPSFYQRCLTAKDVHTAKIGIFLSVGFWIIFDLMTLFLGLVAKYHFPDIPSIYAFPKLSNWVLPPFWKGVVIIAMLSTIISTLESYAFLSGVIIGKNILKKVSIFRNSSELMLIRTGIAISGFFSILLSILIPSAIGLIFTTSSIVVPALFYPLMFSYSKRKLLTQRQVSIMLIFSSIFTLLTVIAKESLKHMNNPIFGFVFNFEPMVIGFSFSTILTLVFLIINKYYKLS